MWYRHPPSWISWCVLKWERIFRLQKHSLWIMTNSKCNARSDPLFKCWRSNTYLMRNVWSCGVNLLTTKVLLIVHVYKYLWTTRMENQQPRFAPCSICISNVLLATVVSRVSKLSMIGSDNGLAPGRRQAIIRTNSGILLIGPFGTNFNEILIKIVTFSVKKCLSLNVLRHRISYLCYNSSFQWPLLLTWFNFNPSMDK